jgi:hypothetical protein
MHKEMFTIYGKKCLSHKAVHNWVEKLSQGRSKVADDARSGRHVEIAATEATVHRLEGLIRTDDRQCRNCTTVFPWFSIQHNA